MTKKHSIVYCAFTAGLLLFPLYGNCQLVKKGAQKITKSAARKGTQKAAAGAMGLIPEKMADLENALRTQVTTAALSNGELLTKLDLLNQMAASIRTNPSIIFSREFINMVETYNNMGIPLMLEAPIPESAVPGQKAVKKKTTAAYVTTFQNSFNSTRKAFTDALQLPTENMDIYKLISSSEQELMLARGKSAVKWDMVLNSPNFSWGYAGVDKITVVPASSALPGINVVNQADFFINQISAHYPVTPQQMFDLLFEPEAAKLFAVRDRLQLLQYASSVHEVLGTEFVSAYVRAHHALPVIQGRDFDHFTNYKSITDYAGNRLLFFVEEFKTASKISFASTAEEQNFLLAAGLLPDELQEPVMQAILKGKYPQAQWLLTHEPDNVKSRQIINALNRPGIPMPDTPGLSRIKQSMQLRLSVVERRIQKASRAITDYEMRANKLSLYIQQTKQTDAPVFRGNDAEAQRAYYRRARAVLDNKIARLQSIRQKLVDEKNRLMQKLSSMPQ